MPCTPECLPWWPGKPSGSSQFQFEVPYLPKEEGKLLSWITPPPPGHRHHPSPVTITVIREAHTTQRAHGTWPKQGKQEEDTKRKKKKKKKKDTKHAARGGCQRRSQLSLGLPFLESLLPSRGMSSLGGSSLFELSDSDQAGDGGSGGCIWKVSWFLDASDDSFLIRLPPLTPFFLLITLEKVSLSYQKRRACQGGPFDGERRENRDYVRRLKHVQPSCVNVLKGSLNNNGENSGLLDGLHKRVLEQLHGGRAKPGVLDEASCDEVVKLWGVFVTLFQGRGRHRRNPEHGLQGVRRGGGEVRCRRWLSREI